MYKALSFSLIFCFLVLSKCILSASDSKDCNATPPMVLDNLSKDIHIEKYKTEVNLMQRYHDSLLNTVYWALGVVFSVAILLVGYGWFSNFKLHEIERQRLKDELDTRIKETIKIFDAKFASQREEVSQVVNNRFDVYLARIQRDIDNAHAETMRILEENNDSIKQVQSSISVLQAEQKISRKRDDDIEANLRVVEENIWNLKKIPTNTLITQHQGLRAAISAENKYIISSILDRMQDTINEINAGSESITPAILKLIKESLSEAEKIEPIAVINVRSLLEKVAVRERQSNEPSKNRIG